MRGPAGRRNLRSVVVAWLRVLLPLAALAILSTLFLLSRRPDPDAAIPYARIDAEARARDPRITAPSFAGVTSDGATIALTADRATPGRDGGVAGADAPRLDWTAPDGLGFVLTAPRAVMQPGAIRQLLVEQVTGPVRWRESVQFMAEQGVTEFWEIGAGKALSGMIRRIAPGAATRAIGTPEDIAALKG